MMRGLYVLGLVVMTAGLLGEGLTMGSLVVVALMLLSTAAGAARWGARLGVRATVAEARAALAKDEEGDD